MIRTTSPSTYTEPIFTRNAPSENFTRAASFEPSSWRPETATIEVIFSTGANVVRSDFEGQYRERLSMEAAAVDLTQLRGASVLDNHDRFGGVASVLGVVEEASVDGKRGMARVRLSQRPELAGFRQDVADGIIRSVSAGYKVSEWKISKGVDGARIKTAVRWTPVEISFVPLGADPAAKTRSGVHIMNEELQTQIRGVASAVNVPEAFADGLIARSLTLEDARQEIIRETAKAMPAIHSHTQVTITRDAGDDLVSRMSDGLRAQINPAHKPESGREFAHMRIFELARTVLHSRGLSTIGGPAELITRAMQTTSDFSAIFVDSFNKDLLTLRTNPVDVSMLFKRGSATDFRARHVLEMSDGSDLLKVNEAGEIKFGVVGGKELASYKIASYARGYRLSFQALANDDLSALSDMSLKITRGARQWFAGFLVDAIISNPKLADNTAVFHASHGNLATSAGAPSEATIAAGKLGLRLQKDASGNPVDSAAKYILTPAALETQIEKLIATLYPQVSSEAEVSARGLTPIIEPRLDAKGQTAAWYLLADPAASPVFEYAELAGYEGPRVESQAGWNTLSTEFRVVWHLGAGAIDSRGAWKNVGA